MEVFKQQSRSNPCGKGRPKHEILSFRPEWLTRRVIADKVYRLFVSLSYFRPDRFVQLLSLDLTLISPSLKSVYWYLRVKSEGERLSSKLVLFCSVAETMNSFSVTNNCKC